MHQFFALEKIVDLITKLESFDEIEHLFFCDKGRIF